MSDQPRIVIFTSPTCSWRKRAIHYFKEKNLRFKEIDVSKNQTSADDLKRLSGQTGVPVILINNKPNIGFDRNKIDRLLIRR